MCNLKGVVAPKKIIFSSRSLFRQAADQGVRIYSETRTARTGRRSNWTGENQSHIQADQLKFLISSNASKTCMQIDRTMPIFIFWFFSNNFTK